MSVGGLRLWLLQLRDIQLLLMRQVLSSASANHVTKQTSSVSIRQLTKTLATFPAGVQLLKAGAQVHHVSKEGRSTALHEAVLRSHGDLVDMLRRASANPFLENGSGVCLTMQRLLKC